MLKLVMTWYGKGQVYFPPNYEKAKEAGKLWKQLPKDRRSKIYLYYNDRKIRHWN